MATTAITITNEWQEVTTSGFSFMQATKKGSEFIFNVMATQTEPSSDLGTIVEGREILEFTGITGYLYVKSNGNVSAVKW